MSEPPRFVRRLVSLHTVKMRLTLALCAVVLGASTAAVPAQAEELVPPTPGTPLPRILERGEATSLKAASPGYAIYSQGLKDLDDPDSGNPKIHRLSDGSVVRPVNDQEPLGFVSSRLWADVLVRIISKQDSLAKTVAAEDVETGTPRWSVSLGEGDRLIAATSSGVLFERDYKVLHLTRPDGTDVVITADDGFVADIPAADPRTVVYRSADRSLHAVDITSGTVADLESEPETALDAVLLTTSKVYWVTFSASVTLHWRARDGSSSGSTAIARAQAPVAAYGEHLLGVATDGSGDLVTYGDDSSEPAVRLHDVSQFRYLGDGSLVAQLLDEVGARLVVLNPDGSTRTVTTLEPRVAPVFTVAVAGSSTYVNSAARTPQGGWTGVLRNDKGSTAWVPSGVPGDLVTASGRTIVTGDRYKTTDRPFQVTTPQGGLDVVGRELVLGGGGELFALLGDPADPVDRIRRTSGGSVVGAVPDDPFALDGDRLWSLGSDGVLTGQDLVDGGPAVTVPSGVMCAPVTADGPAAFLQVSGRWALVRCYATNEATAVDLRQQQPPLLLLQTEGRPMRLGSGYVVRPRVVGDRSVVARVVELGGLHRTRDYGPVHGTSPEFEAPLVVDTGGARRFVYTDGTELPRDVDLSWVDETPDTSAPRLLAATATASPTATRQIGFSWEFRDQAALFERASGPVSYDVRARVRTLPGGVFGAYGQASTTSTSMSYTAAPGSQTCWQVRALDGAGNLSPWRSERCTSVDGAAPVVTAAASGPPVVSSVAASPVTFSYAGADDVGVASFDVAVRVAPPGRALGGYLFPATWQKRTTRSVVVNVSPGGQVCFTVRARDGVGRTSGWSAPRCSSVPLDDRRLTSAGPVTRARSALGLGGTLTRLERPGSQLAIGGQTGRRLAVSVITGPGQGMLDVYVAGRRVSRLNLVGSTTQRRVIVVPGGSGTVVLRDVAGRVVVDALAVLRD